MRLGTLNTDGGPRAVALRDGRAVDLGGSLRQLLAEGDGALRRALDAGGTGQPFEPSRLGPALPDPGKILCVGRNYADHAAELGNALDKFPEIFLRSRTSLAGPYQDVFRSRASTSMDFEVELALVIGRPGRYINAADAMTHIAGYCVFNDISYRDFQNFGSQWIPGKNFDGSGPLGPFLVTADEVADPFALDLTCTIVAAAGSEQEMQHSNTSLMVHRIPDVIAFISQFTTLEPGDVIASGTPGGVGFGRKPPRWLEPGETVVCRVEGVGELKNKVLEEPWANP